MSSAAGVVGHHAVLTIAGILGGTVFLLLFGIPPRRAEHMESGTGVGIQAITGPRLSPG